MIKRGTRVIWHQRSYDKTNRKYKSGEVMQDEHGSSQANVVQFNLKDVSGKYLGIALRETHTRDVYWRGIGFFIPDGGNLIKVPLDELEEIDE